MKEWRDEWDWDAWCDINKESRIIFQREKPMKSKINETEKPMKSEINETENHWNQKSMKLKNK